MRPGNCVLGVGLGVLLGGLGFSASAFAETVTFSYTGKQQEFVVPAGVTSVDVVATGAAGEAAENSNVDGTELPGGKGGLGAVVSGELTVTPKSILYVEVGGTSVLGGFNGGGATQELFEGRAGGGGGASDVRTVGRSEPNSLKSRLLVAAGGGGGGASEQCIGGDGGNANANGSNGIGEYIPAGGGVGNGEEGGGGGEVVACGNEDCACSYGTYATGGAAGNATEGGDAGSPGGEGGALGLGGLGGLSVFEARTGGGGGGGLYGGGGGGAGFPSQNGGGGGGGGSNLVPTGGTAGLEANTGVPPSVVITYIPSRPTATTTTPPNATQSSATLEGTVNPNGDNVTACKFEYGTSTAYSKTANCAKLPGAGTSEVAVSAAIASLTPNTTYDYRISATNALGTAKGANGTFKTLEKKAPSVETKPAKDPGQTGATLEATVNPHGGNVTACKFEYGTTTSYGKSANCAKLPGTGTTEVAVSAAINSLTANTTYDYRISATNAAGTTKGTNSTFKTLEKKAPSVETKPAQSVSQTAATLEATVNPHGGDITACKFEYGTTTSYGKSANCAKLPGAETTEVAVSAAIKILTANTTYDYRISATNAAGTTKGANGSFKT